MVRRRACRDRFYLEKPRRRPSLGQRPLPDKLLRNRLERVGRLG